MDGQRFDEMTRRLGAGLSRRKVLRGLLGGAGALAGTAVFKQVGSAQACRVEGETCGTEEGQQCCEPFVCNGSPSGVCVCPEGQTPCGATCIPIGVCCTNSDCGACEVCDPGVGCQDVCGGEGTICCEATGACYDPATGCCTDSDCVLEPDGTCNNGTCEYPLNPVCVDTEGGACPPGVECCEGLTCYGHDVPGSGGICCPFEWCSTTNSCYSRMIGECCDDTDCGGGECVEGQCVSCIGEEGAACNPSIEGEDCCGGLTCSGSDVPGSGGICCPFSWCPETNTCYHTAVGGCCTDDQCPEGQTCGNDNECHEEQCVDQAGAVCQPSVQGKGCCDGLTCQGVEQAGGEGICCPFEYCPTTHTCYHRMIGECCHDDECGDGICHNGQCKDVCKEKHEHCEYSDDCCEGLFCGHKDKCREHCKEIYDHCKHDHDCCDHLECHHGKCKDTKPHCKEKHDHCKHDDDCCHGLICKHGTCDKKRRRRKPKKHHHHHDKKPTGGTTEVTKLPDTGSGDTADGAGWTSAALAGGAAALFAAKVLRRKPAEDGQES